MQFIGRKRELAIVEQALGSHATVALVGPSGVGKSSLAREIATRHDGSMRFVDCFGLDLDSVAAAVARAAGLESIQSSSDELLVRAADALTDVTMIVLDDYAEDVARLHPLRSNWEGSLLLTRHTPSDDCAVLPIANLDAPDGDAFAGSDALMIFREAARSVNLGFELDERDIPVVRDIITQLHGHPLGIALAGRRAGTTSARTVLDLLDAPGSLLDRQRPERHHSLDAALRFSWDVLEPDEQRALYVMALFRRPLRPETVAELSDVDVGETLELIASLVRRGVVAQGRFPRPLESFVDIARSAFEADRPAEAKEVVRRASAAALEAAQALPIGFIDHPEFGEEPSLWQFIIDRDDHGLDPAQLGAVLAGFLRWSNVRANSFGEVAALPRVEELVVACDQWNAWFQLARHRARDEVRARAALRECTRLADTDEERIHTHTMHAYLAAQNGAVDEAMRAIEAARKLGHGPPAAAVVAAEVYLRLGDLEATRAALRSFDESESQTAVTRAYAATMRAWSEESMVAARRAQEEAVRLCAEIGRLRSEASGRMALGALLCYRLEEFDEGLREIEKGRSLAARVGDHHTAMRAESEALGVQFHKGDWAYVVDHGASHAERDPYCWLFWVISLWEEGQRERAEALWRERLPRGPIAAVPSQDGLWHAFGARVDRARKQDSSGLLETASLDHVQLIDAVEAIARLKPADDLAALMSAWASVRPVYAARSRDLGATYVRRVAQREGPDEFARFDAAERSDAEIVALRDLEGVLISGEWTDLTSRPVSRRLLEILIDAKNPLGHDALGELLYPGEIVTEDAMVNRINVQVSKLRKLGLKPFLAKRPDGFVLEADVEIENPL